MLQVFVGIKKTGSFQHSSFLSGGRVSAAGLITVRHGHIKSLSPLSGHYRTNISHYKQFLRELEQQGADLSRVHEHKAELVRRNALFPCSSALTDQRLYSLLMQTLFACAYAILPRSFARSI